jgi:hypothetical protein
MHSRPFIITKREKPPLADQPTPTGRFNRRSSKEKPDTRKAVNKLSLENLE